MHPRLPQYQQVVQEITKGIEEGKFPADKPLPTNKELAALFNVSSSTIDRAMLVLGALGRVRGVQGLGRYPVIAGIEPPPDNHGEPRANNYGA
jgi:DNA-binding GntR family transcriptional regulator